MSEETTINDTGWQKVVLLSNWGYWDQINGETVQPGRYLIRWPDGQETTETVIVDRQPLTIGDMGHSCQSHNVKAYAEINYHGVLCRVPIRGLFVKQLPPGGEP